MELSPMALLHLQASTVSWSFQKCLFLKKCRQSQAALTVPNINIILAKMGLKQAPRLFPGNLKIKLELIAKQLLSADAIWKKSMI